jgi:hypothetical protein
MFFWSLSLTLFFKKTKHPTLELLSRVRVEAADKSFVDLGRDFERARAKLGQLRTSFDGRSVIDDVVCLQHVAKLLSTELEAAIGGHRETAAQLSDWRTRHATKVNDCAWEGADVRAVVFVLLLLRQVTTKKLTRNPTDTFV